MVLAFRDPAITHCCDGACNYEAGFNLSTVDINSDKYCGCTKVDLPQCGCCLDFEEIIQENYTGMNGDAHLISHYNISTLISSPVSREVVK